jgi:hypothetical protein
MGYIAVTLVALTGILNTVWLVGSIEGVNAGAKMHRRTGVKMHHDGPAAEAQFSRTI